MENQKLNSLIKLTAKINGDLTHWEHVLDLMKVRVNQMLKDKLSKLHETDSNVKILTFICESIEGLCSFNELWGPMYSQLLTHYSESLKPDAFFLQLALILLHTQEKAEFDCTLQEPVCIYIDSHAYIMQGTVNVEFSNAVLNIKWDDKNKLFKQSNVKFNNNLPNIKLYGAQFDIITDGAEYGDIVFIDNNQFSKSQRAEIVADCTTALNLIKSTNENFWLWICKTLKAIVFVEPHKNVTRSGSSAKHAGVIYFTHPINIEHLTTLIVHECAHQYFHLIDELSPIISDGCEKEYYSPYRKMNRPMYFVVLAIHACINILKFIEQYKVMNNDVLSAFLEEEKKDQEEALLVMLEQLKASNGFTKIGQEFFSELISTA